MTDTLITTPFGFESTAAEVVDGVDLHGARAVVTGGSSGIGIATARALASAGAQVTLAVRDTDAGRRTAADIAVTTGNESVRVGHLDLADQASVGRFVAAWDGPLDILVNNAGVMAIPERTLSREGWEMHLATNHLGHFALAVGLHDALEESGGDARIVSVSSLAHLRAPVDFDDLHFARRPYEPALAYSQSKTANVLFAVEATRRWAADGITANALQPGAILDSNLTRHMDPRALRAAVASGTYRFKDRAQGAATSVLLATSPLLEGVGGRYFDDCNEAPVVEGPSDARTGVASYALDPDNAERLWEMSERLVWERVAA
jgi:NAD(P)-dependent dehydrogenase (short-subunit alcohol dehydrogenase family)